MFSVSQDVSGPLPAHCMSTKNICRSSIAARPPAKLAADCGLLLWYERVSILSASPLAQLPALGSPVLGAAQAQGGGRTGSHQRAAAEPTPLPPCGCRSRGSWTAPARTLSCPLSSITSAEEHPCHVNGVHMEAKGGQLSSIERFYMRSLSSITGCNSLTSSCFALVH